MKNINRNLIAVRNMLNITQSQMASICNLGLTSYNLRENNKSPFTQTEMLAIKTYLSKEKGINLSIDDLFFKTEVSILPTA